jgi:hypothetical protein
MIDLIIMAAVVVAQTALTDPAQITAAINAGVAAKFAQDAADRAAFNSNVSLLIQTAGTIALAWIALKQTALGKNMHLLEKNTNSMREELVRVTAKSSRAEGNLEGRAEKEQESAGAKQVIS